MQFTITLLVIWIFFQKCTEGSNILAVFPVADKSTNVAYQKLLKGLADAGHDVTLISAYEYWENLANGSVRDIILTGFDKEYENIRPQLYQTSKSSSIFKHHSYMQAYLQIYNKTYQHPNLKWFLKSNLKFDAFITDNLYAPSLLGFGAIYSCPTIIFSPSIGANPLVTDMVLNPSPLSYATHTFLYNSQWCSFYNFILYIYKNVFKYFYLFPEHGQILEQVFSKTTMDISQLYHNVSLILLGGHESIAQWMPNIVPIGGFHLDTSEELEKDLKKALYASQEVIYVSLEDISLDEALILLKTFGGLKRTVLWNFSGKLSGVIPKNVLIRKQLLTNDVLGHQNIKLFISNADYTSIIETVHHGVPALVIPRTPMQLINADEAESQGYALKLTHIEKGALGNAINQLLQDERYLARAKSISKLFNNGKTRQLDKAVSWIEYIIRHQGAHHLGVTRVNLPWLKLYLLDAALMIFAVGGFGWVFRKLCRKSKESSRKRDKKKRQ